MKNTTLFFVLLLAAFSCGKDQKICDAGFTGDDCAQEIKPQSVMLNYVTLTKYPASNNGEAWDDFSLYADPYFIVTNGATQEVVYTSSYKEEILPMASSIWQVDAICSPDSYFVISFHDYDSANSDEYIGGVIWNAYQEGQNFPINVILRDGDMEVSLILSYAY